MLKVASTGAAAGSLASSLLVSDNLSTTVRGEM
jgi:hypothetical protein